MTRFALLCCCLVFPPLSPLAAQAPRKLKVYISVDMQGIAGIVATTQTSPAGANYESLARD